MASSAGKDEPAEVKRSPSLWAGLRFGFPEIVCLLALAGWAVITRLVAVPVGAELILLAVALGSGAVVAVRAVRAVVRPLLWKLRNRLIVAYVSAVLPIAILLLLIRYGASFLGGEIGVFLVQNELGRRLTALSSAATMVVRAPAERRQGTLERIELFYRERFPGLEVLVVDGAARAPGAPPGEWGEISGIAVRKGLLYIWARAIEGGRQVTLAAPLTRRWLSELTPELGDVSIVHVSNPGSSAVTMRLHPPLTGEEEEAAAIAPAANRFDIELLWAAEVDVAMWDSPKTMERSLLAIHSRLSTLLGILLAQREPVPDLLYGLSALFVVLLIASVWIGVSITRTITGAVHDLYEGTERVMRGDFSHRIQVRGNEQIAGLSRSFNRMTENLEHLLVVAKEKERMQAELEIAREVQNQLFPRSSPTLKRIEFHAMCNPARMVSGDYYDYQQVGEGRIAMAIGDVAGKGISAALLMATLQSSFRNEVRHVRERGDGTVFSTSDVVSRINLQLYADTSPEKYATFFFAVYDDDTSRLTYTNAGHLPPLLIRDGKVHPLDVNGMVVGAFPFATYDESSIELRPGDRLFGYTDGIVEPENEFGEMFGDERLHEILKKAADIDSAQMMNLVMEAVQRHTGSPELQDDMTIVVAWRL